MSYTIVCQLTFNAEVEVKADSIEEAKEIVGDNFWATIGRVSHNADERILDWNVDSCGYPDCIEEK